MYNAEHHQSKAEQFHAPVTCPVCHSLNNTQEHLTGLMDIWIYGCIYVYIYIWIHWSIYTGESQICSVIESPIAKNAYWGSTHTTLQYSVASHRW